jgi:hypothetical protein
MQTYMTWLYQKNDAGWPVHMLYAVEAASILFAVLFVGVALYVREKQSFRRLAAGLAAVFAGVATMWPVALAPFFFGTPGEAMMATLPLGILGTPLAIWFWTFAFARMGIR